MSSMLLKTVVTAVCLLWTSLAQAEDCAPQVSHRRETLVLAGDPGVWFHIEVARCMLADLETLAATSEHARLLEERLRLSDERDILLRREVSLAVEAEQEASRALDAAIRRAHDAEESRDAWHRSPWLWTGVGLVVGVGLVILSVQVLEAT